MRHRGLAARLGVLLGAGLAGYVMTVWAAREISIRQLRMQLYNEPVPLPSCILCVGPSPGSDYPGTEEGCYYWEGMSTIFDGEICVAVDGRTIDSTITIELEAVATVPFDRVDLRVDGRRINTVRNTWRAPTGDTQLPMEMIPNYAFSVPIESGAPIPIHVCWRWEIPPGLHLAEVTIESESSGPLRYQWSFRAVEGE